MSQGSISGVSQAQQTFQQTQRIDGRDPAHGTAVVKPADVVQLSSEARRSLEEMLKSETVAEAYVKHIAESMQEATPSDTEQKFSNADDAERRFASSMEQFAVDLKWLVDALGVPPEEARKLEAALQFRSSLDYRQARPPVPDVLMRADLDRASAAVFVNGLSFSVGREGIDSVAVERVAVIKVDPTLAGQLADPQFPRLVVVGGTGENENNVKASVAAFDDNLTSRLAAAPPEQLHGMLVVRELAGTPENRRLRVDAVSPI